MLKYLDILPGRSKVELIHIVLSYLIAGGQIHPLPVSEKADQLLSYWIKHFCAYKQET
jgi:hypothetical protein